MYPSHGPRGSWQPCVRPRACLSCVVGVLISSPAFVSICSSWPWRVTYCSGDGPDPGTACCDQTLWDSARSVTALSVLRTLTAPGLCPWTNMKKYQQCSLWELISASALFRTKKYTDMSFFLSSFFPLTMFSNCKCCHHTQKAQKVTSFLEQLSPG